jgi:hypothetical protein
MSQKCQKRTITRSLYHTYSNKSCASHQKLASDDRYGSLGRDQAASVRCPLFNPTADIPLSARDVRVCPYMQTLVAQPDRIS